MTEITRITEPGIYSITHRAYHDDPCPLPSLSSSCARLLLDRSPLHVFHSHPRLNTMYEPKAPSDEQEWGTIIHTLFFGVGCEFVEVDAEDWRSKDAKRHRVEARAAGKVPVLAWKLAELERAAEAARRGAERYPEIKRALAAGKPEQAIVWREGPAWCRALVDWLPDDPQTPLLDLKTTCLSAAPQSWERRVIEKYALQAAFHTRGAAAVRGQRPDGMRFIVVEMEAPYGVSVLSPAPTLEALGNDDVAEALEIWAGCMKANRWPGYPPETAWVEAPSWALMRMEERRARDEYLREQRNREPVGDVYQRLLEAAGGPPR